MYILIISRGYPTNKYKVNGIFEYDQAKALANAGHNVVYAAVDMRSIRRWRKWGYESFVRDKVKIEAINIPCGRIPSTLMNKISIIALRTLYKKIYKKYGQPDVIHAHFINMGYLAAKVFSSTNIPLVMTEHFSGMNQNTISPQLYKMGKYTYKHMTKVIAVSNYLANNIKEHFNINALVIPNIVDTNNFIYRKELNNKNDFNFISVGNLVPNKRMDLLIEAFSDTFKNNKKVKLYIYGDGKEYSNLKHLIINHGIEDQIFLKGLVERQEIASQMSKSNCFVLVSQLETFGVAYIEAMAMGLIVIASKCGGPEDFINSENGVLIPVDDKEKLSQAFLYIYNNSFKYDRKRISDVTKAKFSSDVIANSLTKIYREILEGR